MKKKKNPVLIGIISVAVLLVVGITAFSMRYRKTGKGEGFVVIEDRLTGVEYEVYDDYAYISDYYGGEEVELKEEIFGRKITKISSDAFWGSDIKKITIPDSVEYIGSGSFNHCKKLEEVILGKNVKKIADTNFIDCPRLNKVVLNEGLEAIELGCFENLPELKTITIPSTVKKIGDLCFENCGIQSVEFQGDVNQIDIGFRVFYNSEMENSEKYVILGDGILFACGDMSDEVVIPEGVKTINGAFVAYKNSADIYLPKSVVTIQKSTFWPHEPCNIYIPDTVTEFIEDDDCVFGNDVTIITTEGSAAEKYAQENHIKYEIVDDVQVLYDEALERQKARKE